MSPQISIVDPLEADLLMHTSPCFYFQINFSGHAMSSIPIDLIVALIRPLARGCFETLRPFILIVATGLAFGKVMSLAVGHTHCQHLTMNHKIVHHHQTESAHLTTTAA